jgi:hypothetical protein
MSTRLARSDQDADVEVENVVGVVFAGEINVGLTEGLGPCQVAQFGGVITDSGFPGIFDDNGGSVPAGLVSRLEVAVRNRNGGRVSRCTHCKHHRSQAGRSKARSRKHAQSSSKPVTTREISNPSNMERHGLCLEFAEM